MLRWCPKVPNFFPHIFSMTYQDLLVDTLRLCTAMPDFSCICKIGRTNPSELALFLFFFGGDIIRVSSVSASFTYPHRAFVQGNETSFHFRPLSEGCYTQEWVVQEQKWIFSISGQNCFILHRIFKYSLANGGRALFDWEGKAIGSPHPTGCLVGNM